MCCGSGCLNRIRVRFYKWIGSGFAKGSDPDPGVLLKFGSGFTKGLYPGVLLQMAAGPEV